ncbi:MAG: YcgJ family protein [Rhodospirillales bacterium]
MRQMRRSWAKAVAMVAGLAVGAMVVPSPGHGELRSVFFPIKRIVCDRKARACYDYLGASVPLTRAHLGDDSATILERRIRKAGKSWDPTHFTLSNGVDCWTEKKVCYVRAGSEDVDRETTEALFGAH